MGSIKVVGEKRKCRGSKIAIIYDSLRVPCWTYYFRLLPCKVKCVDTIAYWYGTRNSLLHISLNLPPNTRTHTHSLHLPTLYSLSLSHKYTHTYVGPLLVGSFNLYVTFSAVTYRDFVQIMICSWLFLFLFATACQHWSALLVRAKSDGIE